MALKKELEQFRGGAGSNPPKHSPFEESKEHAKLEKPSNPIQKQEPSDDEEFEEGPLDDTEFDEESADCGQREKRLDDLRARIKRHRLKTGGKCCFLEKIMSNLTMERIGIIKVIGT